MVNSLRPGALAAGALALVLALPAHAGVRTPPWLTYPGDPTRMTVIWQADDAAPCTIAWGGDAAHPEATRVSQETGADHLHVETLTGLAPGAHVRYRVTSGSETASGDFTAGPAPDSRRVAFLAYGDTRSHPAADDSVCAAMLAACAADPALAGMLLYVGDFVADGSEPETWRREFLDPAYTQIRALASRVPFQTCIGNHDAGEPRLIERYFPYPWTARGYGAFDYGPVHVAIVNQYLEKDASAAQLAWLDRDLAGTARPWKLVLLHEPGWAADGGHANDRDVQRMIQPICRRHGVAILFAGHNHYYARAMVQGVVHVTTGGGGAPLYTPHLPAPHVVRAARGLHFCAVAVDGDTLRLVARRPGGARIDSFAIVRPGARRR